MEYPSTACQNVQPLFGVPALRARAAIRPTPGDRGVNSQEGIGRFDRRIRTERQARPGIELRLPGIGQRRARSPVCVRHEHVRCGMQGLHGGHNVQLRQSASIVRVQQLHVFDTMAEVRQTVLVFIAAQMLVCVQHFVIGAVADGMHRHAQPHIGRLPTQLEQLLGILIQHAPIFRLALDRAGTWQPCAGPGRHP